VGERFQHNQESEMRKILVVLFAMALFVAGCSQEAGDKPTAAEQAKPAAPLKFGVAGAHSGDLASYGIPSVRAAELVVAKYNENGGVLGRNIQLVVLDEQCKPELATNVATKLVTEQVPMVLGHICSGATKAALAIYKSNNTLLMSPSATNPPLTQSGEYPNFLRTIAPDDAQARLQVDFALDTLGVKRVAVLHDKGDYGKGLAEFAKLFIDESGGKGEVVLFEGITPGAVDYSAVVHKVRQSNADAVIFGGYHPEASKLVAQMRRRGMDITFISDDGVKDDTFIRVAGEFAEGVYATGPRDVSTNPLSIQAEEEHRAKYGDEPGAFFLNAYAATQAMLNAVEKAGTTDFAAVINALQTEQVETPLGLISFDERGDAKGVGFSMYQVKNGVYVEIQ
jgi:branched-chain amino acid transport system substrate-binding protein